jgi:hypothetical protein
MQLNVLHDFDPSFLPNHGAVTTVPSSNVQVGASVVAVVVVAVVASSQVSGFCVAGSS